MSFRDNKYIKENNNHLTWHLPSLKPKPLRMRSVIGSSIEDILARVDGGGGGGGAKGTLSI